MIYNNIVTVGLPFTPAKMEDHDIFNVTEISISCGGGMGGSNWCEYTRDKFDLNDKFIEVRTNRSGYKKSRINTSCIVYTKDVQLVRIRIRNNGNEHMPIPIRKVGEYCYIFDSTTPICFSPDDYASIDRERLMRGDSRFLGE